MLISGSVMSGKSTWVYRLLQNQHLFDKKIKKIYFCYGIWNKMLPKLAEEFDNLELVQGLPHDIVGALENAQIDEADDEQTLIILDDLQHTSQKPANVDMLLSLFLRLRHANCSIIYMMHNYFQDFKYSKIIRRNASYLVHMSSVNNSEILSAISRQTLPGCHTFLNDIFSRKLSLYSHPYLVIVLKPNWDERARVLSDIFPNEYPVKAYQNQ